MGHFIPLSRNATGDFARDATQFHICPPADPAYEQADCLGRLEAHMRERFPLLTFRADHEMPLRQQGEFVLLPMAARAGEESGGGDWGQVLPGTDAELIEALYRALAAFDPRHAGRTDRIGGVGEKDAATSVPPAPCSGNARSRGP